MVDGSGQKNLHEVRNTAIHMKMTQGVTARDQNPWRGKSNELQNASTPPLSACGIAVGRHWRTEGPDPLFKTVRYQLTLQSSNKHWSTQVGSAQVSDIWKG